MNNLKEIGAYLRQKREEKKASRGKVAKIISIAEKTIYNIEKGESVQMANLLSYCNYLEVEIIDTK